MTSELWESGIAKPSPMSRAPAKAVSRNGTCLRKNPSTKAVAATGAAHRNTIWTASAYACTIGAISASGYACSSLGVPAALGDTWGAELHPDLVVVDGAPRIRKGTNGEDGYSGFTTRDPISGETRPTDLDGRLRERGVERVVVCGLATDYCVNATALDAIRLGYETFFLDDAVAAVNLQPGDGERATDAMLEAGCQPWRVPTA